MAHRKLEDIEVHTATGNYDVEGYRVGETLAVNRVFYLDDVDPEAEPHYAKTWNVTHRPSGRSFMDDGVPRSLAAALAEGLVEMGMDTVTVANANKAAASLARMGAGDFMAAARSSDGYPMKARLKAVREYVRERLAGAPPRVDQRADQHVPAADPGKVRGARKPPSRRRKRPEPKSAEPVELDLIALARRARGNPLLPVPPAVVASPGG